MTAAAPPTRAEHRVDLLVIGAGVIGAWVTYEAARAGLTVLLVDRGGERGPSTRGNAGLVGSRHSIPLAAPGVPAKALRWMLDPSSPFYIRPRPDPGLVRWLWRFWRSSNPRHVARAMPVLRDMSRLSLRLLDEVITEHGLRCHYMRAGHHVLFRTPRGLAAGRADARRLTEVGVASELLDREAVAAAIPAVDEQVVGAVHYTDGVHLDPAAFLDQLLAVTRRSGARIWRGAEVLGYRPGGRRIEAVETSRGLVRAREVVLAAGAWSPGEMRRLGLRLSLQPAKGYSFEIPRPDGFPDVGLLLAEAKVAVTCLGETIRLAGTLELAGHDLSINARRVEAIARAARAYLRLATGDVRGEVWCGLRPCSPDGLPYIGRARRFDNLVVATGHGMVGLTLGPATGRLAQALVTGDRPEIDLSSLRPRRRATGLQ